MIFLIIGLAKAVPVPFGIDGTVYGLNGQRANTSVNVQIKNLNTSFVVSGNLRVDGSYSVSLIGESGDTVIVSIWTPYNYANKSFIIENEIHGFNLSLNLSYPLPPKPIPEEDVGHGARFRRFLRRPRIIIGLIDLLDEPAPEGLPYSLTNLQTGEEILGEIQEGFNAFAEVIEGKEGDLLELNVGEDSVNHRNVFPITGEVTRNDVNLNVSKFEYDLINVKNKYGVFALIGLSLIIVLIAVKYVKKKK
jgi:hypothetical protein